MICGFTRTMPIAQGLGFRTKNSGGNLASITSTTAFYGYEGDFDCQAEYLLGPLLFHRKGCEFNLRRRFLRIYVDAHLDLGRRMNKNGLQPYRTLLPGKPIFVINVAAHARQEQLQHFYLAS